MSSLRTKALRSALFSALLFSLHAGATPAGSAFTYQGEVDNAGLPMTATPNLVFRLFDAMSGGNQIGSEVNAPNYPVSAGLLTIDLDFGTAAFNGQARWLEIVVDGNILVPRQQLSATPYSLRAFSVNDGAIGTAQIDPAQVQTRVSGNCAAGSSIRSIAANGTVLCETAGAGTLTSITAGPGLSGGGNTGDVTLSIATGAVTTAMIANGAVGSTQLGTNAVTAGKFDPTQVQARVSSSCAVGSSIRQVNADGTVSCQTDNTGAGTISGVTAGAGISGGGTSGTVSVAIANGGVATSMIANGAVGSTQLGTNAVTAGKFDPTQVQARVTSFCAVGFALRQINADGTVTCQADANSGGTITGIVAGTGLSGGGSTGSVNLAIAAGGVGSAQIADGSISAADIDTTQVQARVSASCSAGSAIRSIAANGGVTCDTPVPGSAASPRPAFSRTDLNLAGTVGESSIALGVDGLPVIAWYNQFSNNMHVSHCADVACSSVSDVAIDASGTGPSNSITINSQGLPVISYESGLANTVLKVATCADVACSSATSVPVDSGNVGRYSSIGINQNGNPVISYYDISNGNLKVVVCTAPNCASTLTPVTLDNSANDVGQRTSLTIAPGLSDLQIVVSYYDATSQDLKVATCSANNCAGPTINTVDALNDAGYANAIMLGNDGLPLIAYWSQVGGNQLARVAHCNSVDCSSATSGGLFTVAGLVLQQAYATSGPDGLPLLAFHSGAAGVKVVHCLDARCSASSSPNDSGSPIIPADPIAFGFVIGSDGTPLFANRRNGGASGDLGITHCSDVLCLPYRRGR